MKVSDDSMVGTTARPPTTSRSKRIRNRLIQRGRVFLVLALESLMTVGDVLRRKGPWHCSAWSVLSACAALLFMASAGQSQDGGGLSDSMHRVKDLFNPINDNLKVREDQDKNIYIENVTELKCESAQEVL